MNLLDIIFFILCAFWLVSFAWASVVAFRANRKDKE